MKKLGALFFFVSVWPGLALGSGIFNPGSGSGGGGGASALEVLAGVSRSSPTATIQFPSGDFKGSVSGSTMTVTIDSTTSNFIQTAPTNSQTTAFKVSSGTVGTQLNTAQIKWTTSDAMALYKDGVTILSMPDTQDTFFGYNTNIINQGGVFNTSYGAAAMPYPGTGNFNNAIGNSSMSGAILSGENNNGMGYAALGSLSSGFYNAAMGGSALNLLTSGTGNTAVGGYALNRNVSSDGNTGVGYRALFLTTSTLNVAIGYEAGNSTDVTSAYTQANGYGIHNVYIGPYTGQSISSTTAVNNAIAIGYSALVDGSNQAQIGGRPGSGNELVVRTTSATIEGLTNTTTLSGAGLSNCGDATHALSWNSTTNLFGCQSIPGSAGGGGGSVLAVSTGLLSGFSVTVASPTSVVNFDYAMFQAQLTGASTAYITIAYSTTTQSGSYTAVSSDTYVSANCGSACTITLSTTTAGGQPLPRGKVYMVAQAGAGNVTVQGSAGNISGGSTALMNQQFSELDVIWDGNSFQVK